jgi:hypothetical protein
MAPGSTQPLTEMSTGNLPGVEGQSARKADNFNLSQPYGPSRPLTAITLPLFYLLTEIMK